MQSSFYVGLSGQLALDRRMVTVAHNVANIGTTGFRAEEMKFESVISRIASNDVAFTDTGASYISERMGGLNQTGSAHDVAVQGAGWLALQTPQGIAYTRDGRLRVNDQGDLLSITGHPILDAGFAPLQISPSGGEVKISHDGSLSQGGRNIGALGLFHIDTGLGYQRLENSAIKPVKAAEAITSFTADGVVQGYLESSNVNGVTEMTNLIQITRMFDSLQAVQDDNENTLKKALQILGG